MVCSKRSSVRERLNFRLIWSLLLFCVVLIPQLKETSSQKTDDCYGFTEVFPYSNGDTSARFSWRLDGIPLSRIRSLDNSSQPPSVIEPDFTGLFVHDFPSGVSSVEALHVNGTSVCNFTVTNTSPCTLSPCPGGNPCEFEESEIGFFCGCPPGDVMCEFKMFQACREETDRIFVPLPGLDYYEYTWSLGPFVESAEVKSYGTPFTNVTKLNDEGLFQHQFPQGTNRVYVFALGEIILCSFDVAVVPNPCALENSCETNFRCVPGNDGQTASECICRANLTEEECFQVDLSQCDDETCNFDAHVCVPDEQGVYQCQCKPGLLTDPAGLPTDCLPAYVSIREMEIFVPEENGNVVLHIDVDQSFVGSIIADLRVTDVTAKLDSDFFIVRNINLTTRSAGVVVTLESDNLVENSENFFVEIERVSPPGVIDYYNNFVSITITDEDIGFVCVPHLVIDVREDVGTVEIPVSISRPIQDKSILIDLSVNDATAVRGEDFDLVAGTSVVIPKMESGTSFPLVIVDDDIREGSENFGVSIASVDSPGQIGQSCSVTISIMDNDDFSTATLTFEGVQGSIEDNVATVVFSLSAPISDEDIEVEIGVEDGTAIQDVDFEILQGVIVVPSGLTDVIASFDILEDDIVEMTEHFEVFITNIVTNRAVITQTNSTVTVFIQDNDVAEVSLEFSDQLVYEEDNPTVSIALVTNKVVQNGYGNISAVLVQSEACLISADDTTSNSFSPWGTLTIPSGMLRSLPILIEFVDDVIADPEKCKFDIMLESPPSGIESRVRLMEITETDLTILDSDTNVTVTISPVTLIVDEGDIIVYEAVASTVIEHFDVLIIEIIETNGRPINNRIEKGNLRTTIEFPTADDDIFTGTRTFNIGMVALEPMCGYTDEDGEPDEDLCPLAVLSGVLTPIVTNQIVTILDPDSLLLGFLTSELFVQEGNVSASVPLSFRGIPEDDSIFPFDVAIRVTGVTASGDDYGPILGTRTLQRNGTTLIEVPITQDDLVEEDEIFRIELLESNLPPGIELDSNVVTVTITDDDGNRVTLSALRNTVSVEENVETISLEFVLSRPLESRATFSVGFEDRTARRNEDYGILMTSSFIEANQLVGSIDVVILNDFDIEGSQQFLVFLDTASNDVRIDRAVSNITVNIIDDDRIAEIAVLARVPSIVVTESRAIATVEFYLTRPSEDQDTTLEFSVEDITATLGIDYTMLGTRTIVMAGTTSATLTVRIINDDISETDESFRVYVVNTFPVISFAEAATTVLIEDDDTACAKVSDAEVQEDEEMVRLAVSIARSASEDITVELRSTDRTANIGSDYGVVPSTVSIPAGRLFTIVMIPIIDDIKREENEEFWVEIVSVSVPASRCEVSATATVVILANDEGPIVEFCPDDIVIYAAPTRTRVFVRWEHARFATDDQGPINVEGPETREVYIPVGSRPIQILYEATDGIGRVSTCMFQISAVETTDYKTYSVSFEATAVTNVFPNDREMQTAINYLLERGECWRDYAGLRFNRTIRNDPESSPNFKIFYDLYLIQESRCCIRDVLNDFNNRLGEEQSVFQSRVLVHKNTHLPVLMKEYEAYLTFDVNETVVNPNIYRDENGAHAQNLQQSLVEQISRGFSDVPDFGGVCVVTPFQIASVSVQVILESRKRQNEDNFQNRLRDIVVSRLDVPEGFKIRDPFLITVADLCPENFCSGNGDCVANLNTYTPNCNCFNGFTGSRCSSIDPRYCPPGLYMYNDVEPSGVLVERNITLPLSIFGVVLTERELQDDPCQSFRAEESLNIVEIICNRTGSAPAEWEINIDCNATLEVFLAYLQNRTIVPENVVQVSGQLANASNLFDNQGSMTTLAQTADLVERVVSAKSSSQEVTSNVTITISNILEGDDDVLAESYQNGTTTKLLESFERQLFQVNVTETGSYSHGSSNIVTMVVEGDATMLDGFGIATMSPEENGTESGEGVFEDVMVVDTSFQTVDQVRSQSTTLLLYPGALVSDFSLSSGVRVTYAAYRRSNLFSSRYYRGINEAQSTFQRRVKKRLVPNTRVISSTLYDMEGQTVLTWDRSRVSGNPNSTFRQWYMPLQDGRSRPDLESSVCTFWNFRADGGRGNWSTDGCEFVSITTDGRVFCECTHLTNFAVLMNIFDDDSITESQLRVLDVTTLFGCGASIVGLIITIAAFTSQGKLRKKTPSHVLIALCFHLIGLYFTFLLMALLDSERQGAFLSDWSCTLMAAAVQFFTLSSMTWMSVEAVNMYYLFVRVINTHISKFLLKACLFAEGFPLVVVGLTIGISKWAGTDYFRKDVCFLNYPWATLAGVAVPLFVLIVFNTVAYALIIYKLNKRVPGRSRTDKSKNAERLKQFQNAVSILLLLGVTWGLGYFCFIPVDRVFSFVFQLLFVIMNSMQGYLIFMLYGMRNPVFRKTWRKLCLCCPDSPIRTSLLDQLSSSNKRYSSSDKYSVPNKFLPSTLPVSSPERRRIESGAT